MFKKYNRQKKTNHSDLCVKILFIFNFAYPFQYLSIGKTWFRY